MRGITGCAWTVLAGRPSGLRRRFIRKVLGRLRPTTAKQAVAPVPTVDATPVVPAATAASATPTIDETVAARWTDVLPAADVPPGQVVEVMLDGSPIAIANVDGQLYAVEGRCGHAGGPLGEGALAGKVLTCPNHGWTYDVTTGRCLIDPAVSVRPVPVRVVGGRIGLRSPDGR
jgi:nitrite reductase/ring-hydroxylating ferredoxin subunit